MHWWKNETSNFKLFQFIKAAEPRQEGKHNEGYIMPRDVCNNDTQCVRECWILTRKVVGVRICIFRLLHLIHKYGGLLTCSCPICWDSPYTPTAIPNQMLCKKKNWYGMAAADLKADPIMEFGPYTSFTRGKKHTIIIMPIFCLLYTSPDLHFILNNLILHLSCSGGAYITFSISQKRCP